MSFFTKTVVVRAGLSHADVRELEKVGEALRDRFQEQDRRIDELQAELAALKREPRASLSAKLRAKGIKCLT